MSKKEELESHEYRMMLYDLWNNAWEYGEFSGKMKPKKEGFYKYMQAFRDYVGVLEKRIEELEKKQSVSRPF